MLHYFRYVDDTFIICDMKTDIEETTDSFNKAQILKPITQHLMTYTLKDSFHLAERLKDVSLFGKKMLSLDVNSLFTNVPLLETADYICTVIKDKQFEIGIPILSLKKLLSALLNLCSLP